MKRFFIITNKGKDPELTETGRVKKYLEDRGAECTLAHSFLPAESTGSLKPGSLDVPEDAECVLVLGGDGTMLQAAGSMTDKDIPLLGINLGTIGYLTEVELSDLDEALDKLLNDDFQTEDRMMLQGVLMQGDNKGVVNYALNDIIIARCSSLQIYNFNIYVNDKLLTSYQADGIILSTPTGSTAYNMSAGGPIVDPKAQILLLTPICPHAANARTIVLSVNDRVTVEIGHGRFDSEQIVEVSLDGARRQMMKSGDKIDISAADKVTKVIKLSSESFVNILRKKIV